MALASNALTSVDAVRAFLGKPDNDVAQDPTIERLIDRASLAIINWTQREFAPVTTSAARKLSYTGGHVLSLAPYDLRTVTSVEIDTDTTAVALLTTDYRLQPKPTSTGTYQWLDLPNHTVSDKPGKHTEREVTVTGAWGFSAVPADVEHACIITVAIWLRRDVQAFTSTFNISEDRLERPEMLPGGATRLLQHYRHRGAS